MENYISNSHKSKEERRVDKVISGSARTKKKNEMRKFTDVFVSEDADNVKDYIFMDIVVPMIKDALMDTLRTILYGGSGRGGRSSTASKISYRGYYERENDRRRDNVRSDTRSRFNFDDIILDNRGEAEDVLLRMDEMISMYGEVSVADLYDMVGITCPHTYNKYGWTNIQSAAPAPVRGGYLLKLPKVIPLN